MKFFQTKNKNTKHQDHQNYSNCLHSVSKAIRYFNEKEPTFLENVLTEDSISNISIYHKNLFKIAYIHISDCYQTLSVYLPRQSFNYLIVDYLKTTTLALLNFDINYKFLKFIEKKSPHLNDPLISQLAILDLVDRYPQHFNKLQLTFSVYAGIITLSKKIKSLLNNIDARIHNIEINLAYADCNNKDLINAEISVINIKSKSIDHKNTIKINKKDKTSFDIKKLNNDYCLVLTKSPTN